MMGVEELAIRLRTFFSLFDAYFLHDPDVEQLLVQTKESLEKKILHNEGALVVITALGGKYRGDIDRAKAEEVTALLDLLRVRKKLQKASLEENIRTRNDETLLKEMFGI